MNLDIYPPSKTVIIGAITYGKDFTWYTPTKCEPRTAEGDFSIVSVYDVENNIRYESGELFITDAYNFAKSVFNKYGEDNIYVPYKDGNIMALMLLGSLKQEIYPDMNKIDFDNPPENYLRWHRTQYYKYYPHPYHPLDYEYTDEDFAVNIDDYRKAYKRISEYENNTI